MITKETYSCAGKMMKCLVCNNEQFNIDVNNRTASCVRCRNIYSLDQLLGNTSIPQKNQLDDFYIEDGILVKYIGTDKHVEIPSDVSSIGKKAFFNNTTLATVILPDTLKCIGEEAFANCTSLLRVEIQGSINEIMDSAFENCKWLHSITTLKGVKRIGKKLLASVNL